jgi:hypothetical protein
VWSGHKKSENQNIKIGACGGWSTKITYIEDYVQNFKALQEELSEQRRLPWPESSWSVFGIFGLPRSKF